MVEVYIGLGSNLGDRLTNLQLAKDLINKSGLEILKESTILETAPVDFLEQPDFLNQVVCIKCSLSAMDLLVTLKNIENRMGREKIIAKGPRNIDLDILLYGDLVMESSELTIPHKAIEERDFVLFNLIELNEGLKSFKSNRLYRDIYHERKQG